jgi:hypothetical protein
MTADDKKKAIAIAAFAVLAGGVLWYNLKDVFFAPAPVASAPAVSSGSGGVAGATAGRPNTAAGSGSAGSGSSLQLDPTLKMGPMLVTEALVYSGNGRNIFSASSVPIALPQPKFNARPAPAPVMPQMPLGPPPPPPIELKFFGTATSGNGTKQVFLLHGEDVFLASAGDVVQRRYKVISVAASSIVVEDMANNNRQTLPLLKNP